GVSQLSICDPGNLICVAISVAGCKAFFSHASIVDEVLLTFIKARVISVSFAKPRSTGFTIATTVQDAGVVGAVGTPATRVVVPKPPEVSRSGEPVLSSCTTACGVPEAEPFLKSFRVVEPPKLESSTSVAKPALCVRLFLSPAMPAEPITTLVVLV